MTTKAPTSSSETIIRQHIQKELPFALEEAISSEQAHRRSQPQSEDGTGSVDQIPTPDLSQTKSGSTQSTSMMQSTVPMVHTMLPGLVPAHFSGDNVTSYDIEMYIESVEFQMRAYRIDPAEDKRSAAYLFKYSLARGSIAAEWYQGEYEPTDEPTWEDLTKAFRKRFNRKDNIWSTMDEIVKLQQEQSESLKQYIVRGQRLWHRLDSTNRKLMTAKWIMGLRDQSIVPSLRMNLPDGETQDFVTVKDLVIKAIALGEGEVSIVIATAAYSAMHSAEINYAADRLMKEARAIQGYSQPAQQHQRSYQQLREEQSAPEPSGGNRRDIPNTGQRRQVICYRCCVRGHTANDCSNPPASREEQARVRPPLRDDGYMGTSGTPSTVAADPLQSTPATGANHMPVHPSRLQSSRNPANQESGLPGHMAFIDHSQAASGCILGEVDDDSPRQQMQILRREEKPSNEQTAAIAMLEPWKKEWPAHAASDLDGYAAQNKRARQASLETDEEDDLSRGANYIPPTRTRSQNLTEETIEGTSQPTPKSRQTRKTVEVPNTKTVKHPPPIKLLGRQQPFTINDGFKTSPDGGPAITWEQLFNASPILRRDMGALLQSSMTRRRAKKVTFEAHAAAPPTPKKYPLAPRITSEHPRDEVRLKNVMVVFIEAWIGETRLQNVIVDSGAIVELIPKRVVLMANIQIYRCPPIGLRLANQQLEMIKEYCWIRINVQGVVAVCKAYIVEGISGYDLLLSCSWMSQVDCVQDHGTGVVTIHEANGTPKVIHGREMLVEVSSDSPEETKQHQDMEYQADQELAHLMAELDSYASEEWSDVDPLEYMTEEDAGYDPDVYNFDDLK